MSTTERIETAHEAPQPQAARRVLTPGTIVLMIGILAVIVVVGIQLTRQNTGPVRGGPAPDFTLNLYGGETFQLSEQRGRIVVVNFWGSWCAPCRDEAPYLQAAHEKYAERGVIVLGVGFRDIDSAALQFIAENNITYPNGPDTRLRITERWGITGAPETYVVDQNGEVVAYYIGPLPRTWLDQQIEPLLQNAGSVS